jgi:hypothetical protein
LLAYIIPKAKDTEDVEYENIRSEFMKKLFPNFGEDSK